VRICDFVDLRSDSVTLPTEEMRKAMYEAECGYAPYEDDPTTARLEEMTAEMCGMEAGLFLPSGTMCNQLAVMSQTARGDEIILAAESHIAESEVGAAPVLSSCGYRVVHTGDGILRAKDIHASVRDLRDIHVPRSSLVCLENALGRGTVVPLNLMEEVYTTAKSYGLNVHTDGARIFNACAALGCTIRDIAKYTDTLAVHLSKGLCAPIGSVMLGPKDLITRTRRLRQMMGGSMSQSGIVAAAGIVALETMIDRIGEDHENARYIAQEMEKRFSCITIDHEREDINLVFFWIDKPAELLESLPEVLLEKGIKIMPGTNGYFRFALHKDVTRENLDYVLGVLTEILA